MSDRDIELFEAIAGDVLTSLGYERRAERPSPEIVEIADRCRAWWRRNMSKSVEADDRDQPSVVVTVPSAGAATAATNPFVFIVGCPRSGTTLLNRIVDAHPLIAITPETHWVPRFHRQGNGLPDDGRGRSGGRPARRAPEVQTPYALGLAPPTSLAIETFGTAKVDDDEIRLLIEKYFDLRPAAIIDRFDLRRPIYRQTAVYGHFGRPDLDLPWEQLDVVADLQRETGLEAVS